ncbi:MarR family transcriptional regulator [Sorangium sp. So ce375]|uniref:MarR family winged helix-turn-helix transcriptional regulator n=1 Tax=Sorangium sp. So ce375 TaxID=3133306 RepID=UPI003F5BD457
MRSSQAGSPSEKSSRLGEVLDFMKLLWAVDHGLQSTSKRMEAKMGVTGPQRLVIRIVGRYPGISAGQLAEIMQLHPSTLTGVLKRLQERGIIERRVDPNDGRRALLGLTARGRELDSLRTGTVEAAVRQALKSVPRRKLDAAQDVLAAVAEALQPQEGDE